jgi:hypothetical protein
MPLASHRRISRIDERFRGYRETLEGRVHEAPQRMSRRNHAWLDATNSSHRQEFVDRCLSVFLAWPELCAREVYVIGRVWIMLRL